MKKFLFLLMLINAATFETKAQNVGIGTTNPLYKFQVTDGPLALYNSTDSKAWFFNYASIPNYFFLSEDGITRLVVANGGNVRSGTSTPSAKLDVHVNAACSGAVTV